MLFLSFMMVERNQKKGEVFMCVLVAIIAILNMIFGYGDAQKKLASLPWEKSSASSAPVGQPGQQQMGGNGLAYDSKTDTYQVNLDGAQARAAAAQGVKEGLGIASQGGNFNDQQPTRPSSVPLNQNVESGRQPQADIEKAQPQAQYNVPDNNSKPIDEKSIELEDPYAQN